MKNIAGELRLEMAQFRELEEFAQFGAELERSTRETLARGQRIREILKQRQHNPVPLVDQIIVLYAVTEGYLDDVAVEDIGRFEEQLVRFLHQERQGLRNAINIQRQLSPELEQRLEETLESFRERERSDNRTDA